MSSLDIAVVAGLVAASVSVVPVVPSESSLMLALLLLQTVVCYNHSNRRSTRNTRRMTAIMERMSLGLELEVHTAECGLLVRGGCGARFQNDFHLVRTDEAQRDESNQWRSAEATSLFVEVTLMMASPAQDDL